MAGGDPISYLVLEQGTDVISADGERVGTVEHVLGDAETDIFDGLVIDTRLGPGGLRFVDTPQIAELREDAAVLDAPRRRSRRRCPSRPPARP